MNLVSKYIKSYRAKYNLTQSDLGDLISMHRVNITKLEGGFWELPVIPSKRFLNLLNSDESKEFKEAYNGQALIKFSLG